MADEMKKKQPLSLNDRHHRLLQGLSSSQTRPHFRPAPYQEDELLNSRLDVNGDATSFYGLFDVDCPPPDEMKASKLWVETHSEVIKDKDDHFNRHALLEKEPSFSGVAELNSHPIDPLTGTDEKPFRVKNERKPLSKDVIEEDSAEKKAAKVKIQGRRRLCKVSSVNNTHDNNDGRNMTATNDPNLADFDSPPPLRNAVDKDTGSVHEIRDILNDLSSRLDLLSIEKKCAPRSVDWKGVPLSLVEGEVCDQPKKDDLPEYESASSSFSLTSDPSNSSPEATNQSALGGGIETWGGKYQEEIDQKFEFEANNVVHRVNKFKNVIEGQDSNETEEITGKSVPIGHTFDATFGGLDDEDDDCVILSGNKMVKGVEGLHGKFQERMDDSDYVDVLDDYSDNFVYEDESSIILRDTKSKYVLLGKIATMLYPHQRDGLKWLWSLHCQGKGGILGDDMGLGKTMQICSFLAGLFHSRLIKRVLIVAPKTLLPHWIKELSAVGLSEKTREYFGPSAKTRQYELQYILQDKGVLLTTYDIVRNNTKALRGDYYICDDDLNVWDYMILDEGHLIKNPGTQRAKSLLEIPSTHRIIISGTPIQNNLKELWALFNFCCPELLGDKKWFKEKYESPILRGNDKNASDREKRIGSTVAKELREHIQPYFLRRLKSDVFREDDSTKVAKLSKKHEIIVWLKLTNCQRQLYEAFLKSELVLSAFDGSPLAAVTILKKICDHPLLLTKRAAEDVLDGMDSMLNQGDNIVAEKLAMHIADATEGSEFEEKHDSVSCKISFIQSLLNHLIPEGHYILIFSQTRKMLNLIQDSLVAKGYDFLRIDGTTKSEDRVKIVNDFQEGIGAPIFLLTSQVGGLGLTLTKADRVIVVDPAWNPSTDSQSVDRAYRIGQKKDVIVYRLMTCGTIEEKIYRKQIYKGGLFKTATEHKEQTRYFSQQDLQELFSLPEQGFDVSLTQQQLHEEHDRQHKMIDSLKAHVQFLETQGIAGVSQHSLLFSKTAPAPVIQEEEEVKSKKETKFMGNSSSTSQLVYDVNGAKYAFNPKDVKLNKRSPSTGSTDKQTESAINDRIGRLYQILANKVVVSKLPDKGENIRKQIAELRTELDVIQREARKSENDVIYLDDTALAGEFHRVLNV